MDNIIKQYKELVDKQIKIATELVSPENRTFKNIESARIILKQAYWYEQEISKFEFRK